jgi:hypothetical protein
MKVTMSEEAKESNKIPMFSGKKKDWVHWSEKFLARAKRN